MSPESYQLKIAGIGAVAALLGALIGGLFSYLGASKAARQGAEYALGLQTRQLQLLALGKWVEAVRLAIEANRRFAQVWERHRYSPGGYPNQVVSWPNIAGLEGMPAAVDASDAAEAAMDAARDQLVLAAPSFILAAKEATEKARRLFEQPTSPNQVPRYGRIPAHSPQILIARLDVSKEQLDMLVSKEAPPGQFIERAIRV